MQELAETESEEQHLKSSPIKELTSIIDDSLEQQETHFNDNDQLSEDEIHSYRFSRSEGHKIQYGHLKPLFFRKDGSGPRVLIGPDCRRLVTRGIYCLPFCFHKFDVLWLYDNIWWICFFLYMVWFNSDVRYPADYYDIYISY